MMMIRTDAGIAIANGMGAVVETATQSARGIDGEIESVRLVQVDETAITAKQCHIVLFLYIVHGTFAILVILSLHDEIHSISWSAVSL